MVDRDLVAAKLVELAGRVDRVRTRCPASAETLASDRDALELVAFNLMLAVQTCLDLASHIIADEGWEAATSLAESFERLGAHGVISRRSAETLREAAKFRNVVAHGYASVDPQRVFLAATEGLHDLERFAGEISTWAGSC